MLPMRELHAACNDEMNARESTKRLILSWVNCSEKATVVCEASKYSDMHLFGLGLCYVLCTHNPLGSREYSAKHELGEFHLLLTNGIDVRACTWHEMRQLVASLQTSYTQLLTYDRLTGYDCKVDVSNFILSLMTRIGTLLATMFLWETVPSEEQVRLSEHYEHEADGYYIVKPSACVELIDVLHSLMRLVLTLMHATPVGAASSRPDITQFHHEASLDDFYNVATARDCLPGSIVAYKHKFHGLFHDVSQVAYYLFPTYTRPVQKPMAELLAGAASGIHILPLLMQVEPDVPVVMEHTSAAAKEHQWSWLVWHEHILLCRRDGSMYCAESVFDLFSYMSDNRGSVPDGDNRAVRPRIA
jgi:hypothetical protein